MLKKSDSELLYLFHQGDEDAFEELLRRYRGMIKSVVYNFAHAVRTSCELCDLEQLATIALFNASQTFNEDLDVPFCAYYKVIMRRVIYNRLRHIKCEKNRSNAEAFSYDQCIRDHDSIYYIDNVADEKSEHQPEAGFHLKELRAMIDAALAEMKPIHREVYRYWSQGYSYEEISRLINVSTKTIDNSLQSIKRKLKDLDILL